MQHLARPRRLNSQNRTRARGWNGAVVNRVELVAAQLSS